MKYILSAIILCLQIIGSSTTAAKGLTFIKNSDLLGGPSTYIPYKDILQLKQKDEKYKVRASYFQLSCTHTSLDKMNMRCNLKPLVTVRNKKGDCTIELGEIDGYGRPDKGQDLSFTYDKSRHIWIGEIKPLTYTMAGKIFNETIINEISINSGALVKQTTILKKTIQCIGSNCSYKKRNYWYAGSTKLKIESYLAPCNKIYFSIPEVLNYGDRALNKEFAEKEYNRFEDHKKLYESSSNYPWHWRGEHERKLLCFFSEGDTESCVQKLETKFENFLKELDLLKKKNKNND